MVEGKLENLPQIYPFLVLNKDPNSKKRYLVVLVYKVS